jgi:ferritin-like metal-binding protein YciE
MEKSTASRKTSSKANNKTNTAFSIKDRKSLSPAKDNDSKFQPGSDVDLKLQSLDPADGILKLFEDCIKDIYWAENHLIKTLPKMAKAASLKSLQTAILDHLEQTKTHAERLEQVFDILGKKPQAKKCDAMEGLSKEGEAAIENTDSGTPARNLAIILSSQKVEHYEISSYTGLIKLAGNLGLNEAADLLSETLTEEEDSDNLLADIADTIASDDSSQNSSAGDSDTDLAEDEEDDEQNDDDDNDEEK